MVSDVLRTKQFDAIVSSSALRARQTAQIISESIDVPVMGDDDRLREHDVPRWTGLTREQIEALDPGVMDRWRNGTQFDLPEAEPWELFEQRVRSGLLAATTHGATVLVVAHAGVLRAIRTGVGGVDFKVSRRKGQWLVVDRNTLKLADVERITTEAIEDR